MATAMSMYRKNMRIRTGMTCITSICMDRTGMVKSRTAICTSTAPCNTAMRIFLTFIIGIAMTVSERFLLIFAICAASLRRAATITALSLYQCDA